MEEIHGKKLNKIKFCAMLIKNYIETLLEEQTEITEKELGQIQGEVEKISQEVKYFHQEEA